MGTPIEVNAVNLPLCERALEELRDSKVDIVAMTRRYPVECIFGDFRRVFANESDVQRLIDDLVTEIARYKGCTQKRP
jgi:hypothetical protein